MNKPLDGFIRPYAPAMVEMGRILDATLIVVALILASAIRDVVWDEAMTLLATISIAIFTVAGMYWNLYRSWRASPLSAEIGRVFRCWGISALMVVFTAHIFKLLPDSGEAALLYWLGFWIAALVGARIAIRGGLRLLRLMGRNYRTVAIVGATAMGSRVANNIRRATWMGLRVVGCFDERTPSSSRTHLRHLEWRGKFDDLLRLAQEGKIDIIYITLPMAAEQHIKRLISRLGDTTASVYYVPDFSTFDLLHAHWDMLGNIPVINAVDTPDRGLNGALKRGFDICASLLILSVIGVPMLAIALGIRLTSPGPIIFRQQRYGLNGGIFDIWKFRSMTVMENGNDFRQAKRYDARVTPFGAFLRRTSLDELPQFINVLQGSMSIVGPRPHPVAMNEQQRKLVQRYMLRHKVKPGITGWAQVNGYRGETDTLEKIKRRIELDLEYIDSWSFWLDLIIILKTFKVIFKDSNAY